MVECSKEMQKYFDEFEDVCFKEFKIASDARKKGYDPSEVPEVILAKNMAERVIGLISVVAPQLKDTDATKRITELEKTYGTLDWRVAFTIAEEVAREKFCKFKDQKEAIEIGIRTGFAYVTVGVVSSPIEGFTHIDIMDRMDGQGKYFCVNFSGPIRNAGGTAAAVCVLIADFLRKRFGYAKYDATDAETKRTYSEVEDYHTRFSPRQYFPSRDEIDFLMKNIPIQIGAESSEKYEVSNYKDLPRVPTNLIRSGFCLLYTDCIPLKAAKLWKQLGKWGKDFSMEDWMFLEEYLRIQKNAKAHKKKSDVTTKISPDYTYIKDLVAGRPVLGYPLRSGGFRLRYGRSRISGYSAQCIHPATMQVLNGYVATATQLKVERPGKAAAMASCDSIDGPIVKLHNGNVLFLETESMAKQHKKEIKEILYLGDVLVAYGDFFNRNHLLVPAGYCQEYWVLEFEKAAIEKFPAKTDDDLAAENSVLDKNSDISTEKDTYLTSSEYKNINIEKLSDELRISKEGLLSIFRKPLKTKLSAEAAIRISKKLEVPLHPYYTFFWRSINIYEFKALIDLLSESKIVREDNKPDSKIEKIILPKSEAKRSLELLGIPHLFVNNEFIVIEGDYAEALLATLNIHEIMLHDDISAIKKIISETQPDEGKEDELMLKIINRISPFTIRDKSGVFVGSRMGRPEKAKMRKLAGQPHMLFPIGEEGGKMRSLQSAMSAGKITSSFPIFYCEKCKHKTPFSICERCDKKTTKLSYCKECQSDSCTNAAHPKMNHANYALNINEIFPFMLKKLETKIFPDMIKGIKGTANANHIPEHLIKGILRAKHNVSVFKDGTVRYDISEVPLTHFKPKEINVSVDKLKKLGYLKDTKGRPLEREDQILELKPQDIVIPCSPDSPDEPSDEVMFRVANFIDELLEKLYGMKPYYKLKSKEDLAGQYVIGLAPHTSAGILGRIIGFSKTQAYLAHPMFHAAMRRDADGDESCILLLLDGLLNFSKEYLSNKRGATMDAPLVLTYLLNPAEVDDMVFDVDIGWRYSLEFYDATKDYKPAHNIKINQLGKHIGTPLQYEGMGFTHDTEDFNAGVLCSDYKLLPSMQEKLFGQMDLATKIRAVDSGDVARLVIEKHFIRDIKGNLRKFSTQQFRCSNCNEKYRRPPLVGKCIKCNGKIIFTISEGSIIKYLEPTISLGEKFKIPAYLSQTIALTKQRIENYFGKETESQSGLGKWFG
ncbi:MAG: DNA polymerase II large subunit [Candidatus Woesearchaeota archaeon]